MLATVDFGAGCVVLALTLVICGGMALEQFSDFEQGPKMQACSERERLFVWHYVTAGDGNGAEAARRAGYSDKSEGAKVKAHQLLHRDRVLAALEEVGKQMLRGLMIPAINATRKMISDPKHPDHAKAVAQTLARLGFGEKSSIDVNVGGTVTVNHTDEAIEQLRMLKGLGVPREKLEEIFGFSGLSRYEGMLAEVERGRLAGPKLIEGEVVK